MRGFVLYWLLCFSWAFRRYDKGEPFVSNLIPLALFSLQGVSLGLSGLGVWLARDGNAVWLTLVAPLAVLFFVVAPWQVWKANHDELTRLKTKRLNVHEPEIHHHSGPLLTFISEQWLIIKIANLSAEPIRGCYGEIISHDFPKGSNILPPNQPLLWNQPRRGKAMEVEIDREAYLNVLVAVKQPPFVPTFVIRFPLDEGNLISSKQPNLLGDTQSKRGIYRVRIRVGSRKVAMPPSLVEVAVELTRSGLNIIEYLEMGNDDKAAIQS